ncbi:MAG TPA: ribonuclease HII [Coriobacteriia bacterium]
MTRPTLDECRARLVACPVTESAALLAEFDADPRSGVRSLAAAHRARAARADAESGRLRALAVQQVSLHELGFAVVAGVDEVGRGALAGPVTAAAVVLDVDVLVTGLDDSKRLSPAKREQVAGEVATRATAWCVAHADAGEIDAVGIGAATRLAMRRAVAGLDRAVDHVLVDGNDVRIGFPATAVVGGDASCACIAAASVIAKVTRDALMVGMEQAHPGYGFAVNKGYGTGEHVEAIRRLGPSPVHRRSFAPCAQGPLF